MRIICKLILLSIFILYQASQGERSLDCYVIMVRLRNRYQTSLSVSGAIHGLGLQCLDSLGFIGFRILEFLTVLAGL